MGNHCSCAKPKSSMGNNELNFKKTTPENEEFERSVTKIQAIVRGHQARLKCRALSSDATSAVTPVLHVTIAPDSNQTLYVQDDANEIGRSSALNRSSKKFFTSSFPNSRSVFLEGMPYTSNLLVLEVLDAYGEFDYSKNEHKVCGEVYIKFPTFNPVQFDDGSIYLGQWKLGPSNCSYDVPRDLKKERRHGRGKQIWPDGSLYEGFWHDGKAEGYGRLIHADGYFYEGQWHNDKVQGKGKYIHPNGTSYEGDWSNDHQQGIGREKYADGSSYEGEYLKGKKNGKGVFIWRNGSKYEGEFKDNVIDGEGKFLTGIDGGVYEGSWQDAKMNGYGTFTWKDGRRYEGHYKNNKKEGFGIYFMNDGKRYEGEWKDGVQHGKGIYVSSSGKSRVGHWKNGKMVQWENSTNISANISQASDTKTVFESN